MDQSSCLAKEGNTVVVPFDGEEDEIGFLKVTGDLGKIIPLVITIIFFFDLPFMPIFA